MAREGLALPPPTFYGSKSKVAQPQQNQIHIQVPCQISKFVADKWDLIGPNVLVQLVKETSQHSTSEYLRVLDMQNQNVVNQQLHQLKWSHLDKLITYELDALLNNELDEVYAITFLNEQDAKHFNEVFEKTNSLSEVGSNTLYPFLVPLTDAIERGDVEEAMKRFKYLCEFPPEQRKFSIRAETPLTPEQIKQQKSVNIKITVENYEGIESQITLCVPKESSIADLKEIMYIKYEIPLEVQKWLGVECLLKNSDRVLDNNGEPKEIYLYILNAAKVGLNRVEFKAKLEAYRNNLKHKKMQQQQQQQQKQQQQQQPMHEDDVPVGPPLTPQAKIAFPMPVGANRQANPNDAPFNTPGPSYVPSEHDPQTGTEEPKVIPGVLWMCVCEHVNAWENIRCERCRKDRD